jgi:hypothetical protein
MFAESVGWQACCNGRQRSMETNTYTPSWRTSGVHVAGDHQGACEAVP